VLDCSWNVSVFRKKIGISERPGCDYRRQHRRLAGIGNACAAWPGPADRERTSHATLFIHGATERTVGMRLAAILRGHGHIHTCIHARRALRHLNTHPKRKEQGRKLGEGHQATRRSRKSHEVIVMVG